MIAIWRRERSKELKWSRFLGQFCGLVKMNLISVHAPFSVSAWPKYAMSGVRFSRAVRGRSELQNTIQVSMIRSARKPSVISCK